MRKSVKGLVIGTAVAVLGATAVFAAGTGSGTGTGAGSGIAGQTIQEISSSADAAENTAADCPRCREGGHCYQDLDNDGVCDYYNAYRGENFSGHHGQRNHHGFCR